MPDYQYRYVCNETPAARCPECHHDWTAEAGLDVNFTASGRVWAVSSRLDLAGDLLDPTGDGAAGYHSHTDCAHCGTMLLDMDGVVEQRREAGPPPAFPPVYLPAECGRVDVAACPRCGGAHAGLVYFKFRERPVRAAAPGKFGHFTTCPKFYEVVLLIFPGPEATPHVTA